MLYCPYCERPVKALVGSCPHCRRPFATEAPPPAAAPKAPGAPSAPPPAARAAPGREIPESDLGDMGGAPVDLAFDPRTAAADERPRALAPSVARAAAEIRGIRTPSSEQESETFDAAEVERLSKLAKPKGLFETPLYAWKAMRRLPALRTEVAAAVVEAEQSAHARLDAMAAWGREHAKDVASHEAMKPAIDLALRTRATLEGFLANHAADLEKFRKDDAGLEVEGGTLRQEQGALDTKAQAIEGELRLRDEDLGRAVARLRRVEIEIRNLERLAAGPIAPSSPHAGRLAELNDQRGKAGADAARLETEAGNLRAEAKKLRDRIAELDAQFESKRAALITDPKRKRIDAEKSRHEEALHEAAAGIADLAMRKKLVDVESEPGRTLQALDAAAEAARRSRLLHEAALASIDRKDLVRGGALAGGALLLVILLLVLLKIAL